jgi:putative transposase
MNCFSSTFDVSLRQIFVTLSTAQLTQYAATSYQGVLDEYSLLPSMSRNGNCWDTACVDSFFWTLTRELVYQRRYVAREEARQATFEYIEVFYNRQRRHSTLSYHSPAEYEARATVA